MTNIKFGTDGWRAIIAKDYTIENVKRISEATARWMLAKRMTKVVIGYDCRFGGKMFAETSTQVFGNFGIKVHLAPEFVSTPMVSLGVVKTGSDLGVVITASHNPPSYNGFKLKSSFGGPTIPKDIDEVEALIPKTAIGTLPSLSELQEQDLLTYVDLESIYLTHVEESFDLDLIKNAGFDMAYDAMYGAGQSAMRKLFPDAQHFHSEFNPSFMGQAPEPIERNLKEFAQAIKADPKIKVGIANDGDADRIGMFDEDGKFVDSHHILLLLLYYMFEFKKETGKVVVTFSVTEKMEKLAKEYGLEFEVTKIGFKYIAEIMIEEDILVGGEESGGLAVKGHIPERDGIWIGLMIMEFMAKTGKTLKQLVEDIYAKVGSFDFDRDDLHITNELKDAAVAKCASEEIQTVGSRKVVRRESIDGHKMFFDSGEWLMVRPSGTEPVLRVYGQSTDPAATRRLLDDAKEVLIG